jgi:hypothetical protein
MNRRFFLSSTMLVGVAALARPAQAFTNVSCSEGDTSLACREILRHHELVAQMTALLEQKGMSAAERQAVLAKAVCPFCGQLLIG